MCTLQHVVFGFGNYVMHFMEKQLRMSDVNLEELKTLNLSWFFTDIKNKT